MNVELVPGKYVIAVSGGVDSVVLLDLLIRQSGLELVVAHFDHGIRADSSDDRKFVESLAKKHELAFEFTDGKPGACASEALARQKRYEFLDKVRRDYGADAIITAHHQDDLLETAIINLMRGTNRRGLTSLKSTELIKRPLLAYPKAEIKEYALAHHLAWREDSTNADDKYLRNNVRHNILPKINREKMLTVINRATKQNGEIDELLSELLTGASNKLDRKWIASMPDDVAREVIAAWLRINNISGYDRRTLVRLASAAKNARNGSKHNILGDSLMLAGRDFLALTNNER